MKSASHRGSETRASTKSNFDDFKILRPPTRFPLHNHNVSGTTFEGVFEPNVMYSRRPGSQFKSEVGCLDIVGLKFSYSNAMCLFCAGGFGVSQICAFWGGHKGSYGHLNGFQTWLFWLLYPNLNSEAPTLIVFQGTQFHCKEQVCEIHSHKRQW